MSKYHTFGGQTYALGSSIGSTDSTILLSSFIEPISEVPYTMALLNTDIVYGTIAPKTSSSEFISFTGITQNSNGTATLTGVTRGLAKKYPFTSSATFKLPHAGQSQFIISDAPQVFEKYAAKDNDETITGTWTFQNFPITPSTPLASDTVFGQTKLSVAAANPSNPIAVGDNDTRIQSTPTASEKAALAGTQGVPSATNKYVTVDNVYVAEVDQSQTTQNSTVEVGMANTTGNKNKIQQSFIPVKTKTRGVKLYKSADTGTFTGTVTVALYADTAGSPSGSALATVTLTNSQWLGFPVGEFEADFSAEYLMTAGTTYWIQVITSTADNSNHPNLATNTAGGYANGSVKYWNTTDGYVAIANIDLYFKTLNGINNQVVETNASGKIPSVLIDYSNAPYVPSQDIPTRTGASGFSSYASSNSDGSLMFILTYGGSIAYLSRLIKDSSTNQYYISHIVTVAQTSGVSGLCVLGSYVYVSSFNSALKIQRYDIATLANETIMTFSGTARSGIMFSNGVDIYVYNTTNQFDRFTLSGTTLTNAGTITYTSSGTVKAAIANSQYVWITDGAGTGTTNIRKYNISGGSVVSTFSPIINADSYFNGGVYLSLFLARLDLLGIQYHYSIVQGSSNTQVGIISKLMAITLP